MIKTTMDNPYVLELVDSSKTFGEEKEYTVDGLVEKAYYEHVKNTIFEHSDAIVVAEAVRAFIDECNLEDEDYLKEYQIFADLLLEEEEKAINLLRYMQEEEKLTPAFLECLKNHAHSEHDLGRIIGDAISDYCNGARSESEENCQLTIKEIKKNLQLPDEYYGYVEGYIDFDKSLFDYIAELDEDADSISLSSSDIEKFIREYYKVFYEICKNHSISVAEIEEAGQEIGGNRCPKYEVEGDVLRISASDEADYIPDSMFETLDDNIRTVIVDSSISSIYEGNFTSCNKPLLVVLPDNICVSEDVGNINASFQHNDRIYSGTLLQDLYGVGLADKINYISLMYDRGIPVNNSTASMVNDYIHQSPEYISILLDLYKDYGEINRDDLNFLFKDICEDESTFYTMRSLLYKLHDVTSEKIKSMAEENINKHCGKEKEELSELFRKEFKGNIPKVINQIVYAAHKYNLKPEDIVNNFSVNHASTAMKNGVPAPLVTVLMTALSKNDFVKAIQSPRIHEVAELCGKAHGDEENREKYLNSALWVLDHPKTNSSIIKDFVRYAEFINVQRNTPVEVIMTEAATNIAMKEIEMIKRRYDFDLNSCKCNITPASVEVGPYRAYIMEATDPRQVRLGYDTNCCQHLGGAGETAMMYGLVNPDAGFFVIENTSTGKVMAQAETWLNTDGTLVFDNIEFADNRNIGKFASIIGAWCEKSPYNKIIMGNGYNDLSCNQLRAGRGVIPPVSEEVKQIIKNEVYTDAKGSVSILKSGGTIEPYFRTAINKDLHNVIGSYDKEKRLEIASNLSEYRDSLSSKTYESLCAALIKDSNPKIRELMINQGFEKEIENMPQRAKHIKKEKSMDI